jgi:hypothetical protein
MQLVTINILTTWIIWNKTIVFINTTHDAYVIAIDYYDYDNMDIVASLQRLVASKLSGGNDLKWCNLGLWTTTPATSNNDNELDTCHYNEACENLAKALGKAAELDANDAVLSCGNRILLDDRGPIVLSYTYTNFRIAVCSQLCIVIYSCVSVADLYKYHHSKER